MLTSPPVMLTLALAIFVVASLVAWIAVPPIRRRALQGGAVDRPGGVRLIGALGAGGRFPDLLILR